MTPSDAGEWGVAAAIAAMAVATYAMRAGGFWLMGHVPLTPRLRRILEALAPRDSPMCLDFVTQAPDCSLTDDRMAHITLGLIVRLRSIAHTFDQTRYPRNARPEWQR
jgi:uncharacterized membrane protein